jgi:hypothetical protein
MAARKAATRDTGAGGAVGAALATPASIGASRVGPFPPEHASAPRRTTEANNAVRAIASFYMRRWQRAAERA